MYLNRRPNGQPRPAHHIATALIAYWAFAMTAIGVTVITLIRTLALGHIGTVTAIVNVAVLAAAAYALADTALYYLSNHVDTPPASQAQKRTGRGPNAAKAKPAPIEPDELIPAGYGTGGPRSHRTGRARHGASYGGRGNSNPT